jgi:hypothetical protein
MTFLRRQAKRAAAIIDTYPKDRRMPLWLEESNPSRRGIRESLFSVVAVGLLRR